MLRAIGDVLDGGLDGDVGRVSARQGQVGGDEGIFEADVAGGGEVGLLPDAGVAIAG